MSDDEWVKKGMSDDSVVVEMLLRLNQAVPPPLPPPVQMSTPALQLEWCVRQRRSKAVPRKKGEPRRASPTTPLSWSGATSFSGGADCFEEWSRPAKPIDNTRSKVSVMSETAGLKRSRRKKTLAELKEEECLLLKERRNLKNELVTLRVTIEKQRAKNESLKRMKLELSHQTTKIVASFASEEATPLQPQQMEVACDTTCSVLATGVVSNEYHRAASPSGSKIEKIGSKEASFLLPDLNLALENDSGSEV